MQITAADLRRLAPNAAASIVDGIVEHQRYLPEYGITTPRRLRHFMAQIAHESAGLRTTREYASGAAYEGRKDLGNTQAGNGRKYRGRGLIQITGRANSRAAGKFFGQPYETQPELMEAFPGALLVSLWYWQSRDINRVADLDDLVAVTKLINGGTNGFADRRAKLELAETIWPDEVGEPILRQGDKGEAVRAWQKALQYEGFPLKLDGNFGPATDRATRTFQTRNALKPDGVVGPLSRAAMTTGRALPIGE